VEISAGITEWGADAEWGASYLGRRCRFIGSTASFRLFLERQQAVALAVIPVHDGAAKMDKVTFPAEEDGRTDSGRGDGKRLVSRISVSLPEALLAELDSMVEKLGFANRSQAVSSILHASLVNHRQQIGDRVMVGTITLFYNNAAGGVQERLASLQRRHIDEVISSLHVHLVNEQTLEVVLVQGPAGKLQAIANAMITERGVISGRLDVVASLIPPIHPFDSETKS